MPVNSDSDTTDHRLSSLSSLSEGRAPFVKRYGLLTQTVSPGSQVRWILPARIRSRKHNDVVFVGETSIQLRECLADGTLLDATAKLYIGTQITSAKVVSATLEKIPTIDAVLKQEWDEEQFLIKGKPVADKQPPQILILCTSANELIYLYAQHDEKRGVKFIYAKRSIIQPPSMSTKWGRHMAVDPESKMLAVASSDTLFVCNVKQIDELKEAIDSWDPLRPTSFAPSYEERLLRIDGTIVRMNFLRSPDEERQKVFLLLMVAKACETKIVLFRWDSRESLIYLEPLESSGQSLPIEDSFPLMLIPSSRPLSFWIVTTYEMAFYENIRSTKAKRISTPLSIENSATNALLWVQWAKPIRHNQYERDKEEILLVREDGMTRYFSRTHNPPSNTVMAITPGNLNIHVDTAVCMLPGSRARGGDILIIGGVESDGGVFWLPPRDFPQMIQPIRNVSPFYDQQIIPEPPIVSKHASYPQKVFSISGSLYGSRINELRFGLEAQGLATIPIDDCAAIDRLWAFEHESERLLHIVASSSEQTVVIAQSLIDPDDIRLLEHSESSTFILDKASLAIEQMPSGTIVQVTTIGVTMFPSSTIGASPGIFHGLDACIYADIDPCSGIFAVSRATESGSCISIGMIRDTNGGPSIVMAPEPVRCNRPFSLRMVQITSFHLLILGFFDGSVQINTVNSDAGVQLQSTIKGTGERGAGVSAIDVLHQKDQKSALILTGSLDGHLTIYTLVLDDLHGQNAYSIDLCASYLMGLTRVSITPDRSESGEHRSALISGDKRLARVSLVGADWPPEFTFDEIWVTDRSNLSAPQPPIRAMCRVPELKSVAESEWSGNVLFGGPDELISTHLICSRQMIPLCYATCGQARHLAYSPFLRKVVVATNATPADETGIHQQPALYLINAELSHIKELPSTPVRFGMMHEKVKALLNWSPSNGRTHYNLVVVALYDGRDSRVGHLSAKKLTGDHDGSAVFKVIMTLPRSEVYAICEFGASSIIVATGNQLIMLSLEVEAKKWSQQARHDLPSPALSLSARGPFVYAATSNHSMIVLRLEGQQFTTAFADKSAKNVRHVVPFGNDGRHVLVSALNGTGSNIYGYMQGSSVSDNPSPSFEAQTPLPIEQIIPIRTNWTGAEHHGFQATTIDGTIYHLKTLSYDEYKMLHFLEKIFVPDITKSAKKQMALLTKKMAQTWVSRLDANGISTFDPKCMHVNGDVIERLMVESAHNLQDLLGPDVKDEDEMMLDNDKSRSRRTRFSTLADLVVGENVDQVEAVLRWARKLLRSSIV